MIINYVVQMWDSSLSLLFGQRYMYLKDTVSRLYTSVDKLIRLNTNLETRLNETLLRLSAAEERIEQLSNELKDKEQRIANLELAGCSAVLSNNAQTVAAAAKTGSVSIPPPPPLPPQTTTVYQQQQLLAKSVPLTSSAKSTSNGSEITRSVSTPLQSKAKRQKPSSAELKARKNQLKTTSLQRSPGGTPMYSEKRNPDGSSPEDHGSLSSLMKKAFKQRFKNIHGSSPASTEPLDTSNDDSFNSQDFSWT